WPPTGRPSRSGPPEGRAEDGREDPEGHPQALAHRREAEDAGDGRDARPAEDPPDRRAPRHAGRAGHAPPGPASSRSGREVVEVGAGSPTSGFRLWRTACPTREKN